MQKTSILPSWKPTSFWYSLTWCCSMLRRKVKMLSIFCVRVCWISRRLWLGNVWNVITSSANRSRTSITSSVWASWRQLGITITVNSSPFKSILCCKIRSYLYTDRKSSTFTQNNNSIPDIYTHLCMLTWQKEYPTLCFGGLVSRVERSKTSIVVQFIHDINNSRILLDLRSRDCTKHI